MRARSGQPPGRPQTSAQGTCASRRASHPQQDPWTTSGAPHGDAALTVRPSPRWRAHNFRAIILRWRPRSPIGSESNLQRIAFKERACPDTTSLIASITFAPSIASIPPADRSLVSGRCQQGRGTEKLPLCWPLCLKSLTAPVRFGLQPASVAERVQQSTRMPEAARYANMRKPMDLSEPGGAADGHCSPGARRCLCFPFLVTHNFKGCPSLRLRGTG